MTGSGAQAAGRCFLSGIDWAFFTLNHLSQRLTGCGNSSQTIFCLDRPLDLEALQARAAEFSHWVPAVYGRSTRAWTLEPYWDFASGPARPIPVRAHTAGSEAEAMAILHAAVNQPFTDERDHLRLIHVTAGERAYLSLVFDHRLFDARGSQAFLRLFHDFYRGALGWTEPFRPVRPSGLTRWREKFLAGRRVNRRFLEIASGGPVRRLPVPEVLQGEPFAFRTLTFDRAQSDRITENAYAAAGYLMLAPYFLAASVAAFASVFQRRLSPGESVVIPVNTDIRPRVSGLAELFFNHLSFFFLRFAAAEVGWTPDWIKTVSGRMYDAMAGGFAQDLAQASTLLRIVPRRFLHRVQDLLMRGQEQTFSFSYVQKGYDAAEFCGARVLNVLHTPRVAIHPGVGIYFTHFEGRLSVTFAYLRPVVTEAESGMVMDALGRLLLQVPA